MKKILQMRPGQLEPNEIEVAILGQLSHEVSELGPLIKKLRVLSREFTGVGSYTKFSCAESNPNLGSRNIGLKALISMPNIQNGLGAVLFCKNGKPECLEIHTYGDEYWDGVYEGFSIDENT